MLFDAHTRLLGGAGRRWTALGGVARRGIYDSMRIAVDQVGVGKQRIVYACGMCVHRRIHWELCNPAASVEKGGVEKNGRDSGSRQNRVSALAEHASSSGEFQMAVKMGLE